ncbi:XrtA system polysaccharide chain length determinant [Salinispirillum marinum]|uniref:XrtA system polysaccharide chain length determinant n=2 Tax=Saccharospirillaceae TaxID=255527 RepID=A0ABV8BDF7_9GAMM
MDLRLIFDLLNGVKRELFNHRFLAAGLFMLISAAIFAIGYVTPKTYTANAMLQADVTNILQPLLRGAAEVTSVNRVNEAREIIYSRSMLERVARSSGLLVGLESDERVNTVLAELRDNLSMRVSGGSYLAMSYSSDSPGKSFRVLSEVLNHFVEESSRTKRAESRNAFDFIESQVNSYKRQLETAEEALKQFRASNRDGTEANVQARIQTLRGNIEDLRLRILESEGQVRITEQQLAQEEPFTEVVVGRAESDVERRLAALRQQLDAQRRLYLDSHPDVVALREQIADLEAQQAEAGTDASRNLTEVIENPVYASLRLRLNTAQSDLQTQQNRLLSMERLLQEEFDRAERIAGNQAEETELLRDYNVTRGVYEEMLQRRESARLSMTLDVEGQGVNYRIQEPASYPTQWDGLQLFHFGLAGPVMGVGLVLGLLGMLVLFDGKVRSGRALLQQLPEDIRLLASVPHYDSTWWARLLRVDVMMLGAVVGVFMLGYMAVLVFSVLGIQPSSIMERLIGVGG